MLNVYGNARTIHSKWLFDKNLKKLFNGQIAEPLKVNYHITADICFFTLSGNLSLDGAFEAKTYFSSLLEEEKFQKVLINLNKVSQFDPNGITWMVWLYRECRQLQKQIVFCELTPQSFCTKQLLCYNSYLKIYKTEIDALRHLKKRNKN